MNEDDMIRLARQAGIDHWWESGNEHREVLQQHLERFAALVREHLLSTEIHSCHANCQRLACIQTRRAVEAEREACAVIAETPVSGEQDDITMQAKDRVAAAIRARGQQ